MKREQRKRLGKGVKVEFDLTNTRPASEHRRTLSQVTRVFDEMWSRQSDGRGGRDMDAFLSGLGDAYIQDGAMHWEPPAALDASMALYLSESVAALNRHLGAGSLRIDEDGNIRLPEKG